MLRSPLESLTQVLDQVMGDSLLHVWSNQLDALRVNPSPDDGASTSFQFDDILLTVNGSERGQIKVNIPLVSPTQVYMLEQGPNRLLISNDPRLFPGCEKVDARAIYSLFQFGAVVAPYCWWAEVAQLSPGYQHTISLQSFTRSCSPLLEEYGVSLRDFGSYRSEPNESEVVRVIDETLISLCPNRNPVVLFSGGVDSGLLAARISSLGWRDARLIHLSFGPADPQSVFARRMASHLGLDLDIVTYDAEVVKPLLQRLGEVYYAPFADHSVIPSFQLASYIGEQYREPRVVLDGTGADGAFGLSRKAMAWRKLYMLPYALRRCLASLYRWLYTSNSGAEYYLRLLRRSCQLPELLGAIATSALREICFHAPAAVCDEVNLAVETLVPSEMSLDAGIKYCLLDLVVTCCRVFAQKMKPVFDQSQIQVRYPYMTPRVLDYAFRTFHSPNNKLDKAHLKSALARQVPHELVYRPKSGFVAPLQTSFRHPSFLQALDEAIHAPGPFGEFLYLPSIAALRRRIDRGAALPTQAYTFLWSLVFGTKWHDQASKLFRSSEA